MSLFCTSLVTAGQFADRLVLVCLDESEPAANRQEINNQGNLTNRLGAIASAFLAAFLEKQSIIIVNSSIIHYTMRYLAEISPNPLNITNYQIEPNKWIKKKITDYLYVLVPHDYMTQLSNYNKISANDDLVFGLKLSDKQDMNDADFVNPLKHSSNKQYQKHKRESIIKLPNGQTKTTYFLSWISDHFIKNLNNIFITNTEYQQKNATDLIPKTIFINAGHGTWPKSIQEKIEELEFFGATENAEKITYLKKLLAKGKQTYSGGEMAGFNTKDFALFTHFKAKELKTVLDFSNTCFGAEANFEEAFSDIKEDMMELSSTIFPFPIISGAISTAPAIGTITINKKMSVQDVYDPLTRTTQSIVVAETKSIVCPVFKNFFDMLNTTKNPSRDLLIDALQQIYQFYFQSKQYINIPIIKEADKPWEPLLKQNEYIFLDDAEVKKQNGKTYDPYKQKPDFNLILTQAFDINCPLLISKAQPPVFISTVPGNSLHHFTEIQAPNTKFSDFISAFFTIGRLVETKAFLIDKLIVQKKSSGTITFTNVLIINYYKLPTYNIVGQQIEQTPAKTEQLVFLTDENGQPKKIDWMRETSPNKENMPESPTTRAEIEQQLAKFPQKLIVVKKPEVKPVKPEIKPRVKPDEKAVERLGQALYSIKQP